MNLLWVSLGGAAGAASRYLVGGWVSRLLPPTLPYGTLSVNLLGSFALAFLMQLSLESGAISAQTRLLIGTGFMGAFTTYSTFNYETLNLLQSRSFGLAGVYAGGMLLGCLLAGMLGFALARGLVGIS